MVMVSTGLRVQGIVSSPTVHGIASIGFHVQWLGIIFNNLPPPPPPPPQPYRHRRRRRRHAGRWMFEWPNLPPCDPALPIQPCDPTLPPMRDEEPDLPRELAYRLAERFADFDHAKVAIRLAWRMRKRRR